MDSEAVIDSPSRKLREPWCLVRLIRTATMDKLKIERMYGSFYRTRADARAAFQTWVNTNPQSSDELAIAQVFVPTVTKTNITVDWD